MIYGFYIKLIIDAVSVIPHALSAAPR